MSLSVLEEGVPGLLPMLTTLPIEAPASMFTGSAEPRAAVAGYVDKTL